jgi:AcrR family transcriptional regulator
MPATRRLPRDERRAQLIDTAASVFLDGGYDGTSMEQVADAAGVTRLIVYRVFESKEALYRAVLVSVTERLRARWEESGPAGFPTVLLRVAREQPDAFRLLWRHASHETLFAVEAEAFRMIVADFASEVIEPFDRDPTLRCWASTTFVDQLYGGVCTWLDVGDESRDDEFAGILQRSLRAMVDTWS